MQVVKLCGDLGDALWNSSCNLLVDNTCLQSVTLCYIFNFHLLPYDFSTFFNLDVALYLVFVYVPTSCGWIT